MTELRATQLDLDTARRIGPEHGLSEGLASSGLFRVLLHNPPLAAPMAGLLQNLLASQVLDPVMRELAVMRVAWRMGAEYAWAQHYKLSRSIGLSDEEIVAVRDFPAATAPRGEAGEAVLRATDEVLDDAGVSEDTWSRLREQLSDEAACVQLLVAISNWRMWSVLMNSLGEKLDASEVVWPPDGLVPDRAR